ncbi:MAG: STAS domain-containing protein [Planctomyces sp.]|nr:STAS domain-containing protein [Planctomyces sp.]
MSHPTPSKPETIVLDGVTQVVFGPDYRMITEELIPAATEALLQAASPPTMRLVIDLRQTEFFGSSFIEILFRVWKRLKERNGRFALLNSNPYCLEVLKVTHLDSLWPICDALEEAVAATKQADG